MQTMMILANPLITNIWLLLPTWHTTWVGSLIPSLTSRMEFIHSLRWCIYYKSSNRRSWIGMLPTHAWSWKTILANMCTQWTFEIVAIDAKEDYNSFDPKERTWVHKCCCMIIHTKSQHFINDNNMHINRVGSWILMHWNCV